MVSPLKTKISPEKWWLEDVFPIEIVPFLGTCEFSGVYMVANWNCRLPTGWCLWPHRKDLWCANLSLAPALLGETGKNTLKRGFEVLKCRSAELLIAPWLGMSVPKSHRFKGLTCYPFASEQHPNTNSLAAVFGRSRDNRLTMYNHVACLESLSSHPNEPICYGVCIYSEDFVAPDLTKNNPRTHCEDSRLSCRWKTINWQQFQGR